MMINPTQYSFTPPTPAPDSYSVRLMQAAGEVRASETLAGASTGSTFINLRAQILAGGFAGTELHLNIRAMAYGNYSTPAVWDDTANFQPNPNPVTNIVVT